MEQSQVKFNRVPDRVPDKVPEKVWEALVQSQVRFNRVSEKVWEALVQSQVRFNRVPEKVPEKVRGNLGAQPSQVRRVPEKVAEAKPGQLHLILGKSAEFPAFGFPARFRKICKNKTLRLLGMPPKLIFRMFLVFIIFCHTLVFIGE